PTLLPSSSAHLHALHSFPTRRSSDLLQPEGRLHVEDHSRLKHDLSHGAGRAAARQSAQSAGMNHQCAGFVASGDEPFVERRADLDRKSTRLNSSHVAISYAVFCLKKK